MGIEAFRERYVYWGLLVSLLLSFSITPVFDENIRSLNIFILSSLCFAILATGTTRRRLIIGCLLGVPFIVMSMISIASDGALYIGAFYLLAACFFVYIIMILLCEIFSTSTVDTNRLLSAISVYLCMGVVWAMLYGMVALIDATAFSITEHGSNYSRINDLMYFSFVTLTTLGYGDIAPISSTARSLSAVEALVGQLYLTVLVARLVGLHIADKTGHNHEPRQDR